ncbi:hypothetical protein PHMEG_0009398 [Phytophthora megakarya]|uniref:Uncharacterized protein n=1 Tax=Phytophthora megakarya TaxID=4795 RepID=A0A225WI32_9STRA|nr:hypothetical protein PHMEG_0009398 [Phytophthora megakarya]
MDATLAAVTQFLSEYEAPGVPDTHHPPLPVDELLLASQLLVSETETSLAQAQSSVGTDTASDSDRNAASPQQTKAERRRKITNAQAAKRRVKYLKRVKDKRETLKQQSRELTEELERMKNAQQKAKKEAEKADALALSVWRATCVRQKERRMEAEEQQRRLKQVVISRAKLIHQMHSLLQHRMASSQLENLMALEGQATGWEKKGTALFKTFVHELDAIYAQTDEVIENSDVKFSSSPMYKRTWQWNQGMTFLESADATVIPFAFEQAKHAVSFAMLSDPRENPRSEGIEDPENTTASAYRLNYSWESGESVSFVVYCAIRRYVEADRVVFVWRARSEGQGEFDGLAMDETVWVVVRPSDAHTQDNLATVFEIYTRLVPTGFGGPHVPPRFVKMFVRSDEEDITYMMRLMEKLLIHQTNPAKRQLRYLKKIRNDRELLKQQTIELSATLTKLQEAQARANIEAVNNLSLGAWRATAIHQKERRLNAEEQQRQLQALLAGQSKLICHMNELLQQRLISSPPSRLYSFEKQTPSRSTSLFKTFDSELESVYAMTNAVWRGIDFKLSPLLLDFSINRDRNHGKTFLESADATIIPFGFQETNQVLSSMMFKYPSDFPYEGETKDPENTVGGMDHLDYSLELGNDATLTMHIVLKRYIEDDRLVFVWRALTEGEGEFEGMYTDETGWWVLRPSTGIHEGSGMVLEAYTRLTPVGFDIESESDVCTNKFIEILAKLDEEEQNDVTGMFEKMLLEEA